MYKVFFKESYFLLTDNKNLKEDSAIWFTHCNFIETKKYICDFLDKGKAFKVILFHDDLEELVSIFKSCFIYVKAAGGAVCNNKKILLIKRDGIYDLPKGHLEAGETTKAGAIREVEEECGITEVTVTAPLHHTFHIYPRNGEWYLKKTYWFTMAAPEGQILTPQTEEGIEEVFWFPVQELPALYDKTFDSLKEVFEKIREIK